MIKKLINKLLGRSAANDPSVAAPAARPPKPRAGKAALGTMSAVGQRVEVPKSRHRIDTNLVDERAVKVVTTLQDAGFEAYIVGGAVRDLLLGHRPKDFDVATNATPAQVKGLFRRAFVIGRRFQLVHVVFGRGREHDVIEVSTFRAMVEASDSEQVAGNEKTSRAELAGKQHVMDASGRVLRDNVWGPQDQDAARRDFTINALYYDPRREIVVDYHHGIDDAAKRTLRMIGDPETRYREDPVRIVRIVRFAAKLGFEIDPKTRTPIKRMAELLANVPASRLFDEMIKLLQTGHSLASLEELRKQGLHRGVFPLLDAVLDDAHRHDGREKFIHLALADTDRRVGEGKPVAPSFMLACMLWHDVLKQWDVLRAQGQPLIQALQQAIDTAFDARVGDISGRGKLAADMREIWTMQPRFERRTPSSATSLVAQPRFRAGFDFLRLRAQAGEVDAALATWWEDYSLADDTTREQLLDSVRHVQPARRARTEVGEHSEPGDEPGSPPAAKRRRRRRKPADSSGSAATATDDSAALRDGH
ncbi:MAG: polynucleotide adenylyltransferase PcnB [Burkholderiales bacterium]